MREVAYAAVKFGVRGIGGSRGLIAEIEIFVKEAGRDLREEDEEEMKNCE